MIEEKLEIIIITYNRSNDLDNTLNELLDSPFSTCKITVLDNCSTDNTPSVCAKYQELYSNMSIRRHKKNIGANPNILRAVETSESLYTWILADDDHYDFRHCDDVVDAIESEKFDLIAVGAPGQCEWEKGLETSSQELIERGSLYFHIFTFIPGFIFKTDLFDSQCIHEGYFEIHNLYPHFPFINKSFEENFSIFTSNKDIIVRGTHNEGGSTGLFWLKSWLNCCYTIKDKKVRRKTIYQSPTNNSFLMRIIFSIISEKINVKESKTISEFLSAYISAFGYSMDQFLLLLIVPLSIIPSTGYKYFVNVYLFIKYDVLKKDLPERSIKTKENDPFRR